MVCAALLEVGSSHGLEPDDIQSRSMGANGVDCILSPAAKKVFGDLAIECKNVQAISVASTFWQHWQKYKKSIALLIHKKNHTEPLVTLRMSDFMALLQQLVVFRKVITGNAQKEEI